MPSIDKSLKKLREVAPALNKAADEAAAVVQRVEKLLTEELGLGIQADSDAGGQVPEPEEEVTYLSYRRVGGRYHITVVVDRGIRDDRWETVTESPWAQCSRDLKLASFPELPSLLENLAKKAEEACKRAAEARQAVEELLGEMK